MVIIDRFEYKFSKWLAGYHTYLTHKQHHEIVSFANKFAAEEFGITRLEVASKHLSEMQMDITRKKDLLELLSDEKNGWYIVEMK